MLIIVNYCKIQNNYIKSQLNIKLIHYSSIKINQLAYENK